MNSTSPLPTVTPFLHYHHNSSTGGVVSQQQQLAYSATESRGGAIPHPCFWPSLTLNGACYGGADDSIKPFVHLPPGGFACAGTSANAVSSVHPYTPFQQHYRTPTLLLATSSAQLQSNTNQGFPFSPASSTQPANDTSAPYSAHAIATDSNHHVPASELPPSSISGTSVSSPSSGHSFGSAATGASSLQAKVKNDFPSANHVLATGLKNSPTSVTDAMANRISAAASVANIYSAHTGRNQLGGIFVSFPSTAAFMT